MRNNPLARVPFDSRLLRAARRGLGCLLATAVVVPLHAQQPTWFRQVGSVQADLCLGATADEAGGLTLMGTTLGDLAMPNAGQEDAWFARYDALGQLLFVRQLGTSVRDDARAAASDGSGGMFVAGSSDGSLGGSNAGGSDAWLARTDATGSLQWIRQFGGPADDVAEGAAADGSGGVFVGGGSAGQALVARYDSGGSQLWMQLLGTSGADKVLSVAADGLGGVYVSGTTAGSMGGVQQGLGDAWLARFDAAGSQLWIRQLGTPSEDSATHVTLDPAGGFFASGDTRGALAGPSSGGLDNWVGSFDGNGATRWMDQFPDTFAGASTPSLASDGLGGVYVATSNLPFANRAELHHYDASAVPAFLGTAGGLFPLDFFPTGLASDGAGGAVMVGSTTGNVGGMQKGIVDACATRFAVAAPTGVAYCASQVNSNGCAPVLIATGTPTLADPGQFQLLATRLVSTQNGIFFFGVSGPSNTPFMGGTLCVKAPIFRLPFQGSSGWWACTGSLAYSLDSILQHPSGGALVQPGVEVFVQAWTRDPSALATTNLSGGLRFTAVP